MTPRTPVSTLDTRRIAAFAARKYDRGLESVRLKVRPLRGGLSNAGVARVEVRLACAAKPRATFVVKRVTGANCRELHAYQALLSRCMPGIAPRLLGAERSGPDEVYLYLEWIETWRKWPWKEVDIAAQVLERLALLHQALPADCRTSAVACQDYESGLRRSAQATLELFEAACGHPAMTAARRSLPALRRLASALPKLRHQLLAAGPPTTVLHGDVHTGNAIVRLRAGAPEPVLLDWGSVRLGSPLEDVCSWLQSLGYWEPEARRRHDSLLCRYLAVRGLGTPATCTMRELYWLAGGSNAMAGALRYHVHVATDARRPEQSRVESGKQVCDWLRVVRRADAAWRR